MHLGSWGEGPGLSRRLWRRGHWPERWAVMTRVTACKIVGASHNHGEIRSAARRMGPVLLGVEVG